MIPTKAIDYLYNLITKNEEVQKFPNDFVTTSMQWVRSWFLIDDPKTEAKLADPARSAESKKTLIESKLEELQDNPKFVQELGEQLAVYAQHKVRSKNIVDGGNIEAKTGVHIGDKGAAVSDDYDEKNIVKGSATIKTDGDFRLGDDVVK